MTWAHHLMLLASATLDAAGGARAIAQAAEQVAQQVADWLEQAGR